MKSEERHHLHENDLAGAVDRVLKKVEPYSNQILIGILVATVVAIGVMMWMRSSGGANSDAWAKFAEAKDADGFLTVADEHPNTGVEVWAKIRAAELFLNQGIRTATSDRQLTESNLHQAEETLQSLLQDKTKTPPQVRERALYAMAVCRETLSNGDTQPAIQAYKALQEEFPQSPYANIAEQRVKDLETEKAKSFYAWFDQQPRKPEDRPKPKDLGGPLTGSADPFLFGNEMAPGRPQNPDRPPSPSAPQRPGAAAAPFPEGDGAAQPPAGETPPKVETPPAEEGSQPPAEDAKPSAESTPPASDAAPATEKPAAEQPTPEK